MQNILNRIKALFTHASSARELGNEAEASAFAAKATELLLKHKLDITDLPKDSGNESEPIDGIEIKLYPGNSKITWKINLMWGVAGGNFCKFIFSEKRGISTGWLVGRKTDRDIVIYLYNVLVELGDRFAARWDGKSNRHVFRIGYVEAIRKRLEDKRTEMESQYGSKAVVLYQATDVELKRHAVVICGRLQPMSLNTRMNGSKLAYEDGKNKGNSVALGKGIETTNTSSKRLIGV